MGRISGLPITFFKQFPHRKVAFPMRNSTARAVSSTQWAGGFQGVRPQLRLGLVAGDADVGQQTVVQPGKGGVLTAPAKKPEQPGEKGRCPATGGRQGGGAGAGKTGHGVSSHRVCDGRGRRISALMDAMRIGIRTTNDIDAKNHEA